VIPSYFIFIISVSILLQLLAAGFALRLVRLTGKITAWAFIAAAISCMAIRRGYTLYVWFMGGMLMEPADFISEVIALFTSALMAAGVALVAPLIVAMQEADVSIRRSEQKFRSLVANIPAIVFTGYADGAVDFLNHKVEEITGYPRVFFDSRQLTWLDIVLPEDLEDAKRTFIQALKGDKAYVREYRIRSKDGKAIWIQERSQIVLKPDGSIAHIGGVFFDITARKGMEVSLQASEARFRAFMEHSPAVAFMKDAEGRYIYVNGVCERMILKKVDEWLGKTDFDIFPPDIAALYHESDLSVLATQSPVQLVSSVPTPSGDQTHWAVFKFPVPDVPDRDIIGGMAVDITDRLLAEEDLLREKTISDTIIDSLPGVFYFFDDQGRWRRWNSYLEQVTGYSGGDLLQIKPVDLFENNDKLLIEKAIQEVLLKGEAVVEADLLLKDGSKIPYLFTGRRITLGDNDYVLGVGIDVSELKRAEEALRVSEANYRNIFENAAEGIFQTTPEGRFLSANPALAQMLGFTSPAEMIDSVTDVGQYHVDAGQRPLFKRILEEQGAVQGFEIQYNRPDGKRLWTSINARIVHGPQGEVYYEGFVEDITARKMAEDSLKDSYTRLRKTLTGIVTALAVTVEMRDPYTAGHQHKVDRLACAIAREMGLAEEQIEGLSVAGSLHDIGKINVPAEILSMPGKLNAIQFQIIQSHPQVGFTILQGIEFPWPVGLAVAQHHERMNGSGYPFGLSGPDIILEARILAVADVVEAMASHRPYRPALGIEKALEEISLNRGILYDSEAVDACVRLFTEKGFTF
jgi:PAS domain S-box-containing protein/putative nucleotidyltransferase with HDIG domain